MFSWYLLGERLGLRFLNGLFCFRNVRELIRGFASYENEFCLKYGCFDDDDGVGNDVKMTNSEDDDNFDECDCDDFVYYDKDDDHHDNHYDKNHDNYDDNHYNHDDDDNDDDCDLL